METVTGPDRQTLSVDREDGTTGEKGPFYVVYGPDAETRWGYMCGNCEGLDNAVDSMGRIHCNTCSNRTKAEEWDAVSK